MRGHCPGRTAPERVFVGTGEAGLHRSINGGRTFERIDTFDSALVTAVAVSPHDPERVWAGTEPSAVYRSSDGGDSWEHCAGLTDLAPASRWSFPPRPHTHHVRWLEPSRWAVTPDGEEQRTVRPDSRSVPGAQ